MLSFALAVLVNLMLVLSVEAKNGSGNEGYPYEDDTYGIPERSARRISKFGLILICWCVSSRKSNSVAPLPKLLFAFHPNRHSRCFLSLSLSLSLSLCFTSF
jgi:hypothetical protein